MRPGEQGGEEDARPVLIEVNAGRWNGEEFQMLAELCFGHDALEATLDAYLDHHAWDALPAAPPAELRVAGKNVKLVARVSGALALPPAEAHADALAAMPSLIAFAPVYDEVGDEVRPTVDLASCAGYAHLVHAHEEVVARDYSVLHGLALFPVEESEDRGKPG
jgi:hypothetical protein